MLRFWWPHLPGAFAFIIDVSGLVLGADATENQAHFAVYPANHFVWTNPFVFHGCCSLLPNELLCAWHLNPMKPSQWQRQGRGFGAT